jgi:hypothetical protein
MKARPADSYDPNERIMMAWRATPSLKAWLLAGATDTGRSLSQHVEMTIETARDIERHLAGPMTMELFRSLAATALAEVPADAWFDDADIYFAIRRKWEHILYRRRPSSRINPQTGEIIRAKLTETRLTLPTTRGALETVIGRPVPEPIPADVAPIEIRLPSLPTIQKWAIDLFNRFAPPPRDNDEPVEVIIEAASATTSREDEAHKGFEAADAQAVSAPTAPQASPPPPAGWIHPFHTAWLVARAEIMGQTGAEPNDMAIAEKLAGDSDLRFLANLHHGPAPTVESILEYRDWLAKQIELGVPAPRGSGAVAAAASPSARQRSPPRRKRGEPAIRQA